MNSRQKARLVSDLARTFGYDASSRVMKACEALDGASQTELDVIADSVREEQREMLELLIAKSKRRKRKRSHEWLHICVVFQRPYLPPSDCPLPPNNNVLQGLGERRRRRRVTKLVSGQRQGFRVQTAPKV